MSAQDENGDGENSTFAPLRAPSAFFTGLRDTFTYMSDEEKYLDDDEWIMGIDEAGRGPVLGPLVYGVAWCRKKWAEEQLPGLNFADSKTQTPAERRALLDLFQENSPELKWAVTVISPGDISRGMLRQTPYNLNSQSHDFTMTLIRLVARHGYNISHCYVDTVGPEAAYQEKLKRACVNNIDYTVSKKADSKFPIVSAASIAAKVTRDDLIDYWHFVEGCDNREFGSGYPSDPRTSTWLASVVDPIFGFPSMVRFSWSTARTIVENKCKRVVWADEIEELEDNAHLARLGIRVG